MRALEMVIIHGELSPARVRYHEGLCPIFLLHGQRLRTAEAGHFFGLCVTVARRHLRE